MNNIKPKHFFISFVIGAMMFISVISLPTTLWAYDSCFYYCEALLDTDNNALTGGSVTVVQGAEAPHDITGIDYIVRVYLDICSTLIGSRLSSTTVSTWNGHSFTESPIGGPPYDIGIEQGNPTIDGHFADVIEFRVQKTAIGNPTGQMKIVYHASINTISANDYTAPFYYPEKASAAIPTLSQWGIIVLSMLLFVSALFIMRKQNSVIARLCCFMIIGLCTSGIAWAAIDICGPISLDGMVGDWTCQNIQPAVTDPIGDSSIGDYGEDIFEGYITSDETYINFRVDIVGGAIPPGGIGDDD